MQKQKNEKNQYSKGFVETLIFFMKFGLFGKYCKSIL